jgi:hypothetical protein
MSDPNEESPSSATAFWKRPQVQLWSDTPFKKVRVVTTVDFYLR